MEHTNATKYLQSLNEAQLEAVQSLEGPVMVLAGPGTGKTQLLSARIAHILATTDTKAENILCLTYTDAGAVAMRNRLKAFIGVEALQLNIHTFHSFCNKVIQENAEYFGIRNLQPISEIELVELYHELIDNLEDDNPLKKVMGDIYSDYNRLKSLFEKIKKENWDATSLIELINRYDIDLDTNDNFVYKKNSKFGKKGEKNLKTIKKEREKLEKTRAALELYIPFQNMMRQKLRYDFNDMLSFVITAFEDDELLLLNYQEELHYFLVDEFQDTNGAQSKILDLLTNYWEEQPNLFVVGDDDQAIYSFQGAEIGRITGFVDKYHLKTPIVLTQNYRSRQAILDVSAKLIDNNQERLVNHDVLKDKTNPKHLKASNDKINQSEGKIELRTYTNSVQESAGIVYELLAKYQAGENLGNTAIIYRNHADVQGIIKLLNHLKIPFNAKQKHNVLEQPLILQIINILNYLADEIEWAGRGEYLLFEILHHKYWNIYVKDIYRIAEAIASDNKKSSKIWRTWIADKNKMFELGLASAGQISKMETSLTSWQQDLLILPLPLAIENILNQSGILDYVMLQPDKLWLLEQINTFFDFIKQEHASNEKYSLSNLLETIDKMNKYNIKLPVERVVQNTNGVNLLTAHSSKGLEFDTVYLLAATAENWESKKGGNNNFYFPPEIAVLKSEKDIEEERRLFYVAITRAKLNLYISYALMKIKDTNAKESTSQASVFVNELNLTATKIELSEDELSNYLLKTIETVSVDDDTLEKEFCNRVLENFQLSASVMNKYLKCPLQFYYENILKIPEARTEFAGFGTAVHYALQKFFDSYKNSDEKELPAKDVLIKYFQAGMKREQGNFTVKTYEAKVKYGSDMLAEYYEEHAKNWTKETLSEYWIYTVTPQGIPIKGSIDRIDIIKQGVTKLVDIVDYKTGNSKIGIQKTKEPSEAQPQGGDYWRQMVFYKILLASDTKNNWTLNTGSFHFMLKDKNKQFEEPVKISPNVEQIEMVEQLMVDTYQKIKNHEFRQGCGSPDCRWCNFQKQNTINNAK